MENHTRFTPEQIAALNAHLDPMRIRTRVDNGAKLSYILGSDAIATANRIFGFDGWSNDIINLSECNRDLLEIPTKYGPKMQWRVGYICTVKVTVLATGVTRVDTGYGSGFGKPEAVGTAIEGAIKEAVTDALKRALRTFGDQFGLSLYDPSQAPTGDPTDYGAVARRTFGRAMKESGLSANLIKTACKDAGIPDDSKGYFVEEQVIRLEKIIDELTNDARYRARIEQQSNEV
jgi:DNA recombination protein Rad52